MECKAEIAIITGKGERAQKTSRKSRQQPPVQVVNLEKVPFIQNKPFYSPVGIWAPHSAQKTRWWVSELG